VQAVAVVADLQKIPAFGVAHRRRGEIVDDQDIDVGQATQETAETAIRMGYGQIAKQLG
jgi:hypothetical protein